MRRAVCEKYGIDIVPITITYDGHSIREYYDVTPEEYWKLIEQVRDIPTTAQTTTQATASAVTSAALRCCARVGRGPTAPLRRPRSTLGMNSST